MSLVHLHRHSEYSRLDGIGTAKQYADRAAELGQTALALTDHGTMSGALHHIKACRDVHILPIVGVEAYYRPNRKLAKRFKQRQAWHLCLYAKNLTGWHNLLRLVSEAFSEVEDGGGFYQYPCRRSRASRALPRGPDRFVGLLQLMARASDQGRRRRQRPRLHLQDALALQG